MVGLVASCAGLARAQDTQPPAQPAAEPASNLEAPAAQQPAPEDGLDLEGLNLDALESDVDLLFEEFDVVVTAGRVAQPVTRTSVPVSVLTGDDLHYSGAPSIPLILDFVPGMDVLQVDRNRIAYGVRGLHHEFSDRTLVLLDGRSVSNPVFGGADLLSVPTFMEDIERIEVVRGPGGAVWGANAFNGVINIINKDPRDTKGFLLSTTLNEYGDTYNHARIGFGAGAFSARFSAAYDDQESSDDAVANDDFDSEDFARSRRFALDGVHELDPETDLSFGIRHAHTDRGSFPFVMFNPGDDERVDYTRAYAKLSHEFSDGASAYVQWYGTFEDVNRPSMWRSGSIDNTLDAQLDLRAGERHELTMGANVRVVSIDVERDSPEQIFATGDHDEQWAGGFVSDRWRAADRLTVETQLRADWYSETSLDWSGRVSALIDLDRDAHHVLRFSGAKAFRAPQLSLRELELNRTLLPSPPFPPDTYGLHIPAAHDLDNEQIWSLEAGYTGRLAEGVTAGVNGYAQWYDDLTGLSPAPDPFGAGRQVFDFTNVGGATAAGIEPELTFTCERGRLSLWYALNDFDMTADAPNARALAPAEHEFGLRSRYSITERLTGSLNYAYSSPTEGDPLGAPDVPEYHRLDLTLAAKLFESRGELMVGVLDVFDETALAVNSTGAESSVVETPGRTLFVRLQVRF
ncbi:MAG TPA: TonB-dependent receptor [Phycisphaerales bacterium]|nr:TonB-dependent receptor [Phycisphaerales bacterium]